MNRAERRRDARLEAKLSSKMFTYDQVQKMCLDFAMEQVRLVRERYDTWYTLSSACALSEQPFNFGKKRISKFMELMFEQIAAAKQGNLDMDTLIDAGKRLGITMQRNAEGHLIIDIDASTKKNKLDNKVVRI